MPLLPGAEPWASGPGTTGTGVLVLHGFTGSPQSVRPWAQALAADGHEVVVPRLPGHGTTWQEANLTRWPDWWAEVERAYDDLRGRCERVYAAGLSMGGTLCLHLAAQRASGPGAVAGVVVVNPHLVNTRWDARWLLPVMRFAVPSWPAIANDIKRPGVTEVAYDRTPVRAAWSVVELGRLVRSELDAIRCPVLVLGSVEDHLVDPVNVELIVTGATGTTVERVPLVDSYHVATLDNDAPLIVERSRAFVGAAG